MTTPSPADRELVTRYLLGELGPDEDLALEAKAESSPGLSEDLAEGRALLTAIRADHPCLNNLDVRGRLRPLVQTASPAPLRLVPQLISLLLLTAILTLATSPSQGPVLPSSTPTHLPVSPLRPSPESSRTWLAATQDLNGQWNPGQWGGQERFKVAVTALAVMALQQPSPDRPIEPGIEDRIRKASQWLWGSADGDGYFGGQGPGTAFNHALATLALLERRDGTYNSGLVRALELIRTSQNRDGGWGRYGEGGGASVGAVTAWQVKTLETAVALGRSSPELDRALRKGRSWMERSGHHTITAPWGEVGGPAHKAGGRVLAAATESLSRSSPARQRAISALLASRGS
ncbi:MAG: hypothetical protein AB7F75_05835 [Planctomycetota bacterium]